MYIMQYYQYIIYCYAYFMSIIKYCSTSSNQMTMDIHCVSIGIVGVLWVRVFFV